MWDTWGAPSASLCHCCPPTSSPGSKGMWQGRGQSHTVEYIISMSTWKGKFYFPTNWKHETRHSLSITLVLYIPLYREKKCEAALQVKDDMTVLHSMEKQTGYAGFRSWALLLKFNRSSPGWRRGWWGEIKVQKLNFSCCPWLPSSLHLQHLLV